LTSQYKTDKAEQRTDSCMLKEQMSEFNAWSAAAVWWWHGGTVAAMSPSGCQLARWGLTQMELQPEARAGL